MRTYWNINNGLRTIDTWQSACWTQVTCPNDEDISFMIDKLNIPEYFIEDIRDKDERSRYEYEDGWVLIILENTLRERSALAHPAYHHSSRYYYKERRLRNDMQL